MRNLLNNRVAKNATWIILSKIIQSIIGLIVTMLTARYLGPSNYGVLNYAMSLVGFVMPVVFLGINNTLVQEITNDSDHEGEIIGTSIGLSMVSSIACILGVFLFVFFVNAGETVTIFVCLLYSLILIFQVLDLIQYWFQSKLLSKYSSLVTLTAYIIVSVYKIVLLVLNKSVYWFAVANTIDYLIISLSLLLIYKRLGGKAFSFSKNRAKALLSRSKHYIVTGLMIAIFAQTDKIMLKIMIDDSATGYYAAAVSCAGMASFVYSAIIDSFRPVLFDNFNKSADRFETNIVRLYSIIIYISLLQSLLMTLFASLIIRILYGSAFLVSANALRIICWYVTFSYLGSVRNIWILCNNLQSYLWIINLSGALLNVVLNLILIPHFGINGAAFASLFTQFFTNFLISYIIKPMRHNNTYIIKSLNPKYIMSLISR